jgi:hypothetical protein
MKNGKWQISDITYLPFAIFHKTFSSSLRGVSSSILRCLVLGRAVVGRLAPVADENLFADGAEDDVLGLGERLVLLPRWGGVKGLTAFADQGAFAIGAYDHGTASLHARRDGTDTVS